MGAGGGWWGLVGAGWGWLGLVGAGGGWLGLVWGVVSKANLVLHPNPEFVHLTKVEEDKVNTVINAAIVWGPGVMV